MFKCINGWTKKKMLAVIKKRLYEAAAFDADEGSCIYRTRNGNKCAIGLFIPKNHDGFKVDDAVSSLLDKYPDLRGELPLNEDGLKIFQSVHDAPMNRAKAKTAMIEWVKDHVED